MKKSKYKIPPQDQHHNRVDIFRAVQPNPAGSKNESAFTISDGAFVNTAFAYSNDNISNILNKADFHRNAKENLPSHKPTSSTATIIIKKAKQKKKTKNQNQNISPAKYKLLLIFVLIFIILALLAIAISLYLTLIKSSDYAKSNRCPVCQKNAYCILNSEKKTICVCRPGYTLNNTRCVQSFCYRGYTPYSNITENSTYGVSLNSVNSSAKPFCCPHDSLSSSCCGVPTIDIIGKNKRIIGGAQSKLGNWPWVVDVVQVYRSNLSENVTIINNCSGALISDRHVLTAAHCLVDDEIQLNSEFFTRESMFRVHFGYANKSAVYIPGLINLHERNVSKIFIHELFDPGFLRNDIAILKLDKPIERDANVDYLCLFNYELDDKIIQNEKLYVAGWGSTSMDMNYPVYSDSLQYVDLEPLPMDECLYINPDPSIYNNSKQICAGFKAATDLNKDTCNGDSGSPLMARLGGQWFHYGIVSFGSQIDCGRGPAIYTRTAFYFDWIQTKKNL